MTEKTSVEHLPNMDKKQCNDYDISNTGREKQEFKSIDEWWKNEFYKRMDKQDNSKKQ